MKRIFTILILCVILVSILTVTVSYGTAKEDAYTAYLRMVGSNHGKVKLSEIAVEEVPASPQSNTAQQTQPLSLIDPNVCSWTPNEHCQYVFGCSLAQARSNRSRAYWEAQQTVIEVPIWAYAEGGPDNYVDTTCTITVNNKLAEDLKAIMQEIHEIKFPIVANRTTAFVYRNIGSTSRLSFHAFGAAIDINWDQNPQCAFSTWQNKYGNDPRAVTVEVVNIFARHGWCWGGDFSSATADAMHFSFAEVAPHVRDNLEPM